MNPSLPSTGMIALAAVLQLRRRVIERYSTDESVPDYAREEIEGELAATERELHELQLEVGRVAAT